jgi:hypothetical protein
MAMGARGGIGVLDIFTHKTPYKIRGGMGVLDINL